MTGERTIAVAGVFDIANYGDQLFPLLAARRLGPFGIRVVAVAPGRERRLLAGALEPETLDWLLEGAEPVDGVLVGGGNIIYNLRTDYLDVRRARSGWLDGGAHSGVWLAAAFAAAIHDAPIAWNAPGVPYPFSSRTVETVLAPALNALDHLSVRDHASAELLRGTGARIEVVPDTAVDLAALWPRETLAAPLAGLSARLGLEQGAWFVAHLRAAPNDPAAVSEAAARLDAFSQASGLRPLLLAIGEDLGDGATARALAARMDSGPALLDAPASLQEVAGAIAYARLYVGGSLHGYITACAYDVPGVIVARAGPRKFAGFLDWVERPADLARSWEAAMDRAAAHLAGPTGRGIPAHVREAADRHWAAILAMLDAPGRKRAERAEFLRRACIRSAELAGPDWLMEPWSRFGAPRSGAAA